MESQNCAIRRLQHCLEDLTGRPGTHHRSHHLFCNTQYCHEPSFLDGQPGHSRISRAVGFFQGPPDPTVDPAESGSPILQLRALQAREGLVDHFNDTIPALFGAPGHFLVTILNPKPERPKETLNRGSPGSRGGDPHRFGSATGARGDPAAPGLTGQTWRTAPVPPVGGHGWRTSERASSHRRASQGGEMGRCVHEGWKGMWRCASE